TRTLVSPLSKSPSTDPSDSPASSTTSRPTRSTQYSDPFPGSPRSSRVTATSQPRSRNAPSRSTHPSSRATGPFECTSNSAMGISFHPSRVCTIQRPKPPMEAARSVKVLTLTQPFTPNGPRMRPTTTRVVSPGREPALRGCLLGGFGRGAGGLLLATLDQLLHRVGGLRALRHPVGDAIEREAILRLVLGRLGIVETDALDEAPVARHARIGNDDVVERAVFGSATRHSYDDHLLAPSG